MSFDKYGSDGHLYVPGVSELIDSRSFEQALRDFENIFAQVVKAVAPIVEDFVKTFTPRIKQLCDVLDDAVKSYPNKRVIWLALYHKKERVRKKNLHRIIKWIERNKT